MRLYPNKHLQSWANMPTCEKQILTWPKDPEIKVKRHFAYILKVINIWISPQRFAKWGYCLLPKILLQVVFQVGWAPWSCDAMQQFPRPVINQETLHFLLCSLSSHAKKTCCLSLRCPYKAPEYESSNYCYAIICSLTIIELNVRLWYYRTICPYVR